VAVIDPAAVHAGAAIAAVRQREGGPDMREIDHVLPLTPTGRPSFLGKKPALADAQNFAHPADGKAGLLAVDEGEPHRLPSLAKKPLGTLPCNALPVNGPPPS